MCAWLICLYIFRAKKQAPSISQLMLGACFLQRQHSTLLLNMMKSLKKTQRMTSLWQLLSFIYSVWFHPIQSTYTSLCSCSFQHMTIGSTLAQMLFCGRTVDQKELKAPLVTTLEVRLSPTDGGSCRICTSVSLGSLFTCPEQTHTE